VIVVPKGHKTGEELEEEAANFSYILLHKFLPLARLFFLIAALGASVTYLIYQFIYKPVSASNLYKKGYELIENGNANAYTQANRYFNDAFSIHKVKDWFYKYAERFRDERQYLLAEEKYDQLLYWYPHDKKGALDYSTLEAYYMFNYEKADKIIRQNILDYLIDDMDGLIALGDVNLDWADIDSSRFENARAAYARVLALYGWTDDVLERMLLYFIRTDKLGDVIPLQKRFMSNPKSKISPAALAELGGYLLDKRLEVPDGIPDENLERIEGIKDILLRAQKADPELGEAYYNLGRYFNYYNEPDDERRSLVSAKAAFQNALNSSNERTRRETPRRTKARIDTQLRLANMYVSSNEFIAAENELVDGINIYEDAVTRRIVERKPEFGRLYADFGDIEYFAKEGNMEEAQRSYLQAEANGYLPPEIEYRLGGTYYKMENYPDALKRFFNVSTRIPFNRKLLNSLAVSSLQNSDFFTAESYYKRLLAVLRQDRGRISAVLPDDVAEHRDLMERILIAENNLGVVQNNLASSTGKNAYRTQAMASFADAERIADLLARPPATMVRQSLLDNPGMPTVNRPFLNMRSVLYPLAGQELLNYPAIDNDVLEPSNWEKRMASF